MEIILRSPNDGFWVVFGFTTLSSIVLSILFGAMFAVLSDLAPLVPMFVLWIPLSAHIMTFSIELLTGVSWSIKRVKVTSYCCGQFYTGITLANLLVAHILTAFVFVGVQGLKTSSGFSDTRIARKLVEVPAFWFKFQNENLCCGFRNSTDDLATGRTCNTTDSVGACGPLVIEALSNTDAAIVGTIVLGSIALLGLSVAWLAYTKREGQVR